MTSISVRSMLKLLAALVATVPAAARAQQPPPGGSAQGERLIMSAFIARLRQDPGLRVRFVENPRAVMLEYGIDPAPFNLPDRLTDAQLQNLLADWSRQAGPQTPPPGPNPGPPAPVYGPPPGLRQPTPPPVVYGAPPGPPRRQQ